MKITNEGYRVLKGSYVEGKERKSFSSHTYYSLRKKIEKEGYLSESDFKEIYILNNEIDFSSASAAAAIIKNRATNGKKEWKLNNGTTLDDYENNLIS